MVYVCKHIEWEIIRGQRARGWVIIEPKYRQVKEKPIKT